MKTKFTGFFIAAMAVALLSACGGGGGGGSTPPPTPTTVTVTCPNGTSSTAATTDAANTACPGPKMVSVTPADGDKTASPDSFTGIAVVTDSTLDASSLTNTTVTLKVGTTTTIAGTVSATDTKGFKLVPTAKLNYGQAYDFAATVKDTLGKTLTVKSTFTTAPMICTAPSVWNGTACAVPPPPAACVAPAVWTTGVNACVYPMGVKVVGANQLPQGCNAWASQCWKDSVANGTVKFIATSATNAPGRPIVFGFFRNTSTAFGVTGLWNYMPFYADDGSLTGQDISGGVAEEIDWAYGSTNGIIVHGINSGVGSCSELYYYAQGYTWSSRPVTCPL